jgi:hypothetical protein
MEDIQAKWQAGMFLYSPNRPAMRPWFGWSDAFGDAAPIGIVLATVTVFEGGSDLARQEWQR